MAHALPADRLAPHMKRSIRKNNYGNWVGYVGRSREVEFGENERGAKYWLETGDAEWFDNAYL